MTHPNVEKGVWETAIGTDSLTAKDDEIINHGPMLGFPKAAWLNALKTVDKNRGALFDPEGPSYSAVGALCLAYMTYKNAGTFHENGSFTDKEGNSSRSGAPHDVRVWAGIPARGAGINWKGGDATIVAVNDELGQYMSNDNNFNIECGHIDRQL